MKIWNDDIRNGIIGGFYFQFIWIALVFIFGYVKSKVHNISIKEYFLKVLELPLSYRMIAVFCILLFTVIFSLMYVRKKQDNPIKWNFEGFLGMTGSGNDGVYTWRIHNFQATGINNSFSPITNIYGYIELGRNQERFPIKLNKNGHVVDLDEFVALPKDEVIDIAVFFDNTITNYGSFRGYEPEEFLKKYVPFKLVMLIEGREFEFCFTTEMAEKNIRDVENRSAFQVESSDEGGPIFKNK